MRLDYEEYNSEPDGDPKRRLFYFLEQSEERSI